ncbi:MAG: MFS transporter [Proteobacteria bacterium]|nr:MFS transporter [Pseudomonadota bacterium]
MSVYSLGILIGPLTEAFDWTRAEVSFAKTILTTGFVLTGPIMGYLADRYGVRRIGIISLITLSIAMFSMTQVGPSILSFILACFCCRWRAVERRPWSGRAQWLPGSRRTAVWHSR